MNKDSKSDKKQSEDPQRPPIIKVSKVQSESSGEAEKKGEKEKEEKVRLKSKARKIFVGLIISLSAVMFGYSIKYITSVSI